MPTPIVCCKTDCLWVSVTTALVDGQHHHQHGAETRSSSSRHSIISSYLGTLVTIIIIRFLCDYFLLDHFSATVTRNSSTPNGRPTITPSAPPATPVTSRTRGLRATRLRAESSRPASSTTTVTPSVPAYLATSPRLSEVPWMAVYLQHNCRHRLSFFTIGTENLINLINSWLTSNNYMPPSLTDI